MSSSQIARDAVQSVSNNISLAGQFLGIAVVIILTTWLVLEWGMRTYWKKKEEEKDLI
jgi:hypothetical protein